MQERELRELIEEVREGKLPRRGFIQQMLGLGLTAPMAAMMLTHSGIAQAQTALPYKPTKRGGGGTLMRDISLIQARVLALMAMRLPFSS